MISDVERGWAGFQDNQTFHFLQLLSRTSSPSFYCNSSSPSPITFQNRRNTPGDVSIILDRTEFGSELEVVRGNAKSCFLGVHCYPDGGASLEEVLEEENLEDANLVDVEVKAEP
ncbi:hypothetical protein LR48_Vigan665s000200 [Vigna angularis]|uniref:Uncharacterized protein n=1 Tax=Phaseolus angularis TaxID=3914 RepID=A0A0L9TG33_PHAAN|nr:hypothetical protein LR48_Vigan665s000200 [Vigna angularis]